MQFVLASGSPRRHQLLSEVLAHPFSVHTSAAEEWDDLASFGGTAEAFVVENARLKGSVVCPLYPDAWVLAADTTVFLDEEVLNKPLDVEHARSMLRRLSGRQHWVYTGFFLRHASSGRQSLGFEKSAVWFKSLTEDVIERYFAEVNPLDKAGAYGIQEGTELILEKIEGSFSNVMGLPVERLRRVFSEDWGIPVRQ